jgi:hypothetical protein
MAVILIAAAWILPTLYFMLRSVSSFVFDDPPENGGRLSLFVARFLFIAPFWWLMLPSQGGRKALKLLMKGETSL